MPKSIAIPTKSGANAIEIGLNGPIAQTAKAAHPTRPTTSVSSTAHTVRNRRILEATMLLEANLDLPALLHHIVEEARSMTNARYGALGVLDEEGTGLAQFITAGLPLEEVERIGAQPTGKGVLGLLIVHPKTIRLTDLSSHPESFGFPANHPRMESFLGVPIRVRGSSYGNLYLTEKMGWSEFTRDDEALVAALDRKSTRLN